MKRLACTVLPAILVALPLLCGCTTYSRSDLAPRGAGAGLSIVEGEASSGFESVVQADRKLIWKAHLNIEVWSVSNTVAAATAAVEQAGGFLEQKSSSGEASALLTLRIPAAAFKSALASFEQLGTVTYRNVNGTDVTGQYIDTEARLKNMIVLRDRLQQLLAKAADVKDIMAIEKELNRIQADIDSLQGRLKAMQGQVDYATVTLHLKRRAILGPLGYVFKGLFWGVGKLFVIRN
jgi:hypothetical protein